MLRDRTSLAQVIKLYIKRWNLSKEMETVTFRNVCWSIHFDPFVVQFNTVRCLRIKYMSKKIRNMSHVHKTNLDYILSMMMLINSKRKMDHQLQFPYHLDTGMLSHIIIVCNDKKAQISKNCLMMFVVDGIKVWSFVGWHSSCQLDLTRLSRTANRNMLF